MAKRHVPEEHTDSSETAVPSEELVQRESAASEADREQNVGAEPELSGQASDAAAVVEPLDQAVQRLRDELDAMQDRYLRLAAEFDNFKKRMARERAETWSRAQAEVIANSLDALDDLGRVTSLDSSTASVEDVLSGVQLVERKLLRELEGAGLQRVGRVGEDFDPNLHEAVATLPAASAEVDGTVAAVLQIGYQFGNALLRPARVQVSVAPDDDGSGGAQR